MNGDLLWGVVFLTVPAGFFYGAIWGRKFGFIFNEVNFYIIEAIKTLHFLKGVPFIIAGLVSLGYFGKMKIDSLMLQREVIKKPNIEVHGTPAIFTLIPSYYSYPNKELHHKNVEKDILKMIENGLDINVTRPFYGDTALYYAGKRHQWRIALILLKAGADPLIKNDKGLNFISLIENQEKEAVREAYQEILSHLKNQVI